MTDPTSADPTATVAEGPEDVAQLRVALDAVVVLADGVDAHHADGPTPCQEWTVAQLLDHLADDLANFEVSAAGGTPDWSASVPSPGPDWAEHFRRRADRVVAAWQERDLGGTIDLPGMGQVPARMPLQMQVAELSAHAYDLSRATGGPAPEEALAESGLAFMQGMLKPEYRKPEMGFGPEQHAPEGADANARLAAFAGRDPSWER